MSTMFDAIMRDTTNRLEALKDASLLTETAFVWNPNTQSSEEYLIINIIKAPDTYCYGRIEENDELIDVHYSPYKHMWSR